MLFQLFNVCLIWGGRRATTGPTFAFKPELSRPFIHGRFADDHCVYGFSNRIVLVGDKLCRLDSERWQKVFSGYHCHLVSDIERGSNIGSR
jgi:hypothetical protein